MQTDQNCLSFWFPKIQAAGLPVPETTIILAEGDRNPVSLLDGKLPEDYEKLVADIKTACGLYGPPAFLRTGHGSGKHEWAETCFVQSLHMVPQHIRELVEWSHIVSPMGLPTHVWAVRRMIPTDPLFRVAAWNGFPVTREFRVFVFDGEIVHLQPYWPPEAIEDPLLNGQATPEGWKQKLERASEITTGERVHLEQLARETSAAVPGYWSVDFLEDRHGKWWLTDMAFGEESFRWAP